MRTSPLADLLRRGWALPLAELSRLGRAHLRVDFRAAGLSSGWLASLADRPSTAAGLAERVGVPDARLDGLTAWLDLGVAVGDLRVEDGRYRPTRRVRRLLRPANDPLAAFYEEYADLDHALVREAPARLLADRGFTLDESDAAVIARTSRISEPFIRAAVEQVVPTQGAFHVLEVGCGSGAHLRTVLERNTDATAVGLELQEPAADQARANLRAWHLDQRCEVRVADVRCVEPRPEHDLVTLHQNIYYFPTDQRVALLRHLTGFLRPGGRLLVTTVPHGSDVGSAALDLWAALTDGCSRLPTHDELTGLLVEAGFHDVSCQALGPGGVFVAASGTCPPAGRVAR